MIWLTSAAAQPSSSRKATDSPRTGTPRAEATSGSTVAKNSGRAMAARTASTPPRPPGQGDHLAVGDPEEGAEQQAGEAVEEAAVEADEQDPAGQGEGLDGPDHRRLLGCGPAPPADRGTMAITSGGGDAPGEVAGGDADPEPDGAGGAREGHHGQGVAGEALAPRAP